MIKLIFLGDIVAKGGRKAISRFLPEFKEKYYKFYDSVSFISSTLGSIVACNMITPFVRGHAILS